MRRPNRRAPSTPRSTVPGTFLQSIRVNERPGNRRNVPGTVLEDWRRHPDSNRGVTDLQSVALPLGYAARRPARERRSRTRKDRASKLEVKAEVSHQATSVLTLSCLPQHGDVAESVDASALKAEG